MSTDLGRVILPAVVAAVVGLLVMESYQTTPWLANRLMQWSVRLRYTDNPERAKVRGEELTALLGDLPTLFTLPTAGAFLLRALAYRLAYHRRPARREPRTVQRSLGVRIRIALVKASLVVACVGAVFGIELFSAMASTHAGVDITDSGRLVLFALAPGISAAVESVIRPSRFPHGLFGGIVYALTFVPYVMQYEQYAELGKTSLVAFFGGMGFWVATRLACALVGKFKHVGVIVGILVNIAGVALPTFTGLFSPYKEPWVLGCFYSSGFGLAVGVLAGFATVMVRRSDSTPTPAVLADSLAGSDAVNPEPPIAIGEPSRQE